MNKNDEALKAVIFEAQCSIESGLGTEEIAEAILESGWLREHDRKVLKDDYFRKWAGSLLTRNHEQAGIAYAKSIEVILLREQLELVTEPDDRPLWRRIAAQRRAIRQEIQYRERVERWNTELRAQIAALQAIRAFD